MYVTNYSLFSLQTVLDAWAKSGGGRASAERAEEILEWMDRLYKGGNPDVKPDTITFNAGKCEQRLPWFCAVLNLLLRRITDLATVFELS